MEEKFVTLLLPHEHVMMPTKGTQRQVIPSRVIQASTSRRFISVRCRLPLRSDRIADYYNPFSPTIADDTVIKPRSDYGDAVEGLALGYRLIYSFYNGYLMYLLEVIANGSDKR